MQLSLKFDLRAPAFGADPADLYAAALDMCAWADAAGFECVRFLEHHGSDDRYCPSPLVMAAAAAARTRRVRIRVRALILPLHDPVRIAEDAAVVDVISRGRLELVVAAGYVAAEVATALGAGGQLEFHPLVGGADPALGWSCLTLFDQEVRPALESAGLVTARSAP